MLDIENNLNNLDIDKDKDNKEDTCCYNDAICSAMLSLLVYEYNKIFKFNKNETIKDFLDNINSIENLDNLNYVYNLNENKLSDYSLQLLKNIKDKSPGGTIINFFSDPVSDIQVGITKSDTNKRITIIFRGSESFTDWIYDFKIKKESVIDDNIKVHKGMYDQLHDNNVFDKLIETIKNLILEYKDYNIIITGHSLGGGLSILFGFELSHIINNDINVITFASPRVGNYEFKNSVDKKENLFIYRFCNYRDIVTALPMINYYHVGNVITLYDNKVTKMFNYNYNKWFQFSILNCWSVKAHNMELYYERILNLY